MKEGEHTSKLNYNSSGITGVVLGIISLMSLSFVGVVLGIIGLVFSIVQHRKMRNKWSLAGIIINVIGIVGGIVGTYFAVNYVAQYIDQLQQLQNVQP